MEKSERSRIAYSAFLHRKKILCDSKELDKMQEKEVFFGENWKEIRNG
jgi:hypothetical protein